MARYHSPPTLFVRNGPEDFHSVAVLTLSLSNTARPLGTTGRRLPPADRRPILARSAPRCWTDGHEPRAARRSRGAPPRRQGPHRGLPRAPTKVGSLRASVMRAGPTCDLALGGAVVSLTRHHVFLIVVPPTLPLLVFRRRTDAGRDGCLAGAHACGGRGP